MKFRSLLASLVVLAVLLRPAPASAQWVVYDPSNYAEAVATLAQLVQQYQLLLQQTRQLPVNLAARYRVPSLPWPSHNTVADYARPLLLALNEGDPTGTQYAQTVIALDPVQAIVGQIPAVLRERVGTAYATIELADRVARTAIHQAGALRVQGAANVRTIQAMEDDAVSGDARFHTQTALLNKINGANVLNLRIAEQSSQSLLHVVEQLLVTNKRERDTEAKHMDAQIYQWRFGQAYGQDLFSRTAQGLDTWRQP